MTFYGTYRQHSLFRNKLAIYTFNVTADSLAEAIAKIEQGPCARWIISITERKTK